ncbi:hypothetical protein D7S89_16900 [Trinickia fusca]|uniref:Uncharacterized protein n=2 Tax=Trinickia fusca TaxID=2419777 RepID=A0A494X6K2_9BURK|nr:hypothetical protein D7S89_16900 [Trinickia fusca]
MKIRSSVIDHLKELIQALEKQQAQLQQQIAQASASVSSSAGVPNTSKVEGLMGEASSISSALQTARAELVQAMLNEGKTTGLLSAKG